jgi:hypothetical protein
VWFGLFLWFVPAGVVTKIVLLRCIGIPLIFIGAGARALGTAYPQVLTVLESGLRYGLPALCIGIALLSPRVSQEANRRRQFENSFGIFSKMWFRAIPRAVAAARRSPF